MKRGSAPNRVAVLSHAYWARRFGSDPAVLGRTMTIDQVPHTIIGVTPAGILRAAGRAPSRRERPHRRIRGAGVLEVERAGRAPCAGRLPPDGDGRPERPVSAIPRRRQDPVRARAGPGFQVRWTSHRRHPAFRSSAIATANRCRRCWRSCPRCCCSRARTSPASFSRGRPRGSGISRCAWRSGQPGRRLVAPAAVGNAARYRSPVARLVCWSRGGASTCWSGSCRISARRTICSSAPDRNVLLFTLAASTADRAWASASHPPGSPGRSMFATCCATGGRTLALGGGAFKGAHRRAGRAVDGPGRGGHTVHGQPEQPEGAAAGLRRRRRAHADGRR